MSWLEETHGVQFELVRHFLRRMFDGEWSSSPGQWRSAAIGAFSLLLPAGLLLVREGSLNPQIAFKYQLLAMAADTAGIRAAAMADELALITLLMCVTGLIALLEWQSLFPSGRDYMALASLPVRSRQVFTARFTSVLLFSAVIIAAMNLLPSLIAPMEFGGGWGLGSSYWLYAGAQAVSSGLACFFVFFAILALQGVLLNVMPAGLFARVSVYVQGALAGLFLLAGFYSWSIKEWKPEIIAHHATGASAGPTEAMNLLIEKVRRVGHGFKSFRNYRLRLLLHCGVDWPPRSAVGLRPRPRRRPAQLTA